jgi:hypothetical protein
MTPHVVTLHTRLAGVEDEAFWFGKRVSLSCPVFADFLCSPVLVRARPELLEAVISLADALISKEASRFATEQVSIDS